jgi:hypothetical protein
LVDQRKPSIAIAIDGVPRRKNLSLWTQELATYMFMWMAKTIGPGAE